MSDTSKDHKNGSKKPSDTGRKFTGHNQSELKGCVLNLTSGANHYNELKERLQTMGGSKYSPNVGRSIETLTHLRRIDFKANKPQPEDWMTITTNKKGEDVKTADPDLKEELMDMYKEEVTVKAKEYCAYVQDMKKMYAITWGQLDDSIQEKVKAHQDYNNINTDRDLIKLLTVLRDICYQGNQTKIHAPTNLIRAHRKLITFRQRGSEPAVYVKQLIEHFDVFKSLGGTVACEGLIKHYMSKSGSSYADYEYLTSSEQCKIKKEIEQEFMASLIVEGSDEDTSNLRQSLGDQFNLGVDQYPTNTSRALEMLIHFKGNRKSGQRKQTAQPKPQQRQGTQKPDDKKGEQQDSTAFVNKGEEKKLTGRQMLMNAIEANEDFGQDYNLFFQIGVEGVKDNQCDDSDDEMPGLEPRINIDTSSDEESGYESPDDDDWMSNDDEWLDNQEWSTVETTTDHSHVIFGNNGCARHRASAHDTQAKTDGHEPASFSNDRPIAKTNIPTNVNETSHTPYSQHHQTWKNTMDMSGKSVLIDALDLSLYPAQKHNHNKRESYHYKHTHEYMFAQMRGTVNEGAVNKCWLLLDSESSCNLIVNKDLLKNIRKAPDGRYMTVHCNSGVAETDMIGELPGFGEVWYYPDGIANVLSLALVSDRYPVSMDTRIDNAFHVHKMDGSTHRFERSECNLYYSDLNKSNGTCLAIKTIEGNKTLFSDLDVRRAEKARALQDKIGFPSTQDMKRMIDNNIIKNCPVTRRDLDLADKIFGPNTAAIQGKSTRRNNEHVHEELISLPSEILENYGIVTLCVDIFTVNGINFLHTISRHLRFRTTCAINDMKQDTLLTCLLAVVGNYKARGFTVTQIFADNQFQCLQHQLATHSTPIQLHCVPAGAHEPTVERSIRTIKDNMRCHFNNIPVHRLPKRCVAELAYAVTYWLNCRTTGISKTLSAREILTGIPLDASTAKFEFFEPIMALNDDNNNSMNARAVQAVYLRPTGTLTGGFYAFDIATGRRIHRHRATSIPLSSAIMRRIDEIAAKQNVPLDITFTSHPEVDNPDDDSYIPSDNDDSDASLEGVIAEPEALQDGPEADHNEQTTAPTPTVTDESNEAPVAHTHADDDNEVPPPLDDDASIHTNPTADDDNSNQTVSNNSDESTTHELPRLRPRVHRTHNKYTSGEGYTTQTHHRSFFTAGYTNAIHHLGLREHGIMLVAKAIHTYSEFDASQVTKQYGVKQGIKKFGDKGIDAVLKELQQFHDRGVAEVMSPKDMTKELRQQALPYLMFLKRKRCGKIKGRGCADGRKQREFIPKEEATSPTVSLHALMLSCLIDAIEERDVATADIPGAFLQTDMPEGEDVFIRLDGTMAELLCRIDPKMYQPHLIDKDGKKILYAKAKKAIYGTLRAAVLFWENLTGKLKEWGFEANPYDACTMNKVINGKQCTIMWHVDDLKISHVDPKIVTEILDKLDKEYGQISPLTRTRGKIHEYVGMTIDFTTKGKVRFSMDDYLEDLLRSLPDDLKGECATPASDHLFKVTSLTPNLSTPFATGYESKNIAVNA